ncbi:NCS1 family nucleobase:cation symporter-1 [Pseudomonas guariconensis]|uniref:NCS1 family nucleobase:cation symporter-1 n=1 Tax=Pseudomonas guariconensis TaxID=1288410 RepID=UPI0018AB626E|nr:NCS1 family nucleobase:cation symporter-1 [Pseudomonas guariconensis]MBF8721932.1 NCS1 family nucleobase:cation symporter-1 [Pseudomonas guariconensis]MBF8743827.1 NCS1 family nucleobase:cation symporter-1 [Pseudomonas guariconensis]MBF8753357.1 NCS1 family nucleobase:cation symporter-1 [Pseudomonas guariconensis]
MSTSLNLAPELSVASTNPTSTPLSGDLPDLELSPRLHNRDLAPTRIEGRRWGRYSIFALWTNDVHNIANYSFAMGLFALGLGGWQILLSLAIGAALVYFFMNLSGYMGQKTGVPFPVISRIAFGIHGAQIPALIRAVIAIAWFGIQTYLASVVLRVLLTAIWPQLAAYDHDSILGLSSLGWVCFVAIWLVQLVILAYGMEMVRRYEAFAGPVILLTVASLAGWMYFQADARIAWSVAEPLTGYEMWRNIFAGGALWLAIYGTLVLNFCDFARSSPCRKTIRVGNFWGLPVNILVFATITAVLCGAQFQINGQVIDSPTQIVANIPSTPFLVLGCLAFLIVTVAVNIMANFVAPAFVLSNLAPRHLNFRRAGLISATLAVLILPWNLYNSPLVIVYFLSGLGALLGPLYGVIMADYWLLRKGQVNVPQLYSENPAGAYFYTRGINLRAVAAFLPTALLAIVLALVPNFHSVAPFSWLIGAGTAAALYLLLAPRNRQYLDVSGEAIAVDHSSH